MGLRGEFMQVTLSAPAVVAYRDRKRYAWLFSLLIPALVGLGPALYLAAHDARLLWAPVILIYAILPFVDILIGPDRSNPPEELVEALENQPFYRYITYAIVPLLWAIWIFAAWFVGTHPLPWYGWLALVLSTGVAGGFCINVGHELGHKRTALERRLAKIILAPTGYGHFYIEHNRGHHRDVATPEDPASARMGESIYKFLLREMPGAFLRAWKLEQDRLARMGQSPWTWQNEILQPLLLTVLLYGGLTAWLGLPVLPFLLAAAFWSDFQLTSANYIEHYGLLRRRLANGRYEVCRPQHSWNSNHAFSNWASFHLQRHSDHHAHPTRRYQALRHYTDLPELPTGYFGMFLLAYVPPLWYRVMDPLLIRSVRGDCARINFDPARRRRLVTRYNLA
jgi:alkane 1-monooxygenase